MIIRPLIGGFVVQVFLTACVCDESESEGREGIPELYFTTLPSSVTVQQGESVLLPCAATGEQPVNITWRQGTRLLSDRRGALAVQPNGSLWLQIGEDTLGSVGESTQEGYQCCASNALGKLCSPAVSVVATEALSQLVVSPANLEVVLNGSARLECQPGDAASRYPVQWQKDGQDLVENSRYTFLPSGVLQITSVTLEDMGEYHCITGNPAAPLASKSSQVTVVAEYDGDRLNETTGQEEEFILEGPQDVTVNVPTEGVILECLAVGSWVDIQWTRSGSEQLPSGRTRFIGNKNLELINLSPEDDGLYTCQANDTRTGQVSKASAMVEVTDFSAPQFTERPHSGIIDYFTTARLHCQAEGNPRPEIDWYLNGEPIVSRFTVRQLDSLIIWNAEKVHEGIYQCVASNAVGTVQSSTLLTVLFPDDCPDPPFNLTAVTIDSSKILIRWQAAEGITTFSLHYSEPDGVESQKVIAEERSHMLMVENLLPYTNYTFYMRAYTNTASRMSEEVIGRTAEEVPAVAPKFSLTSSQAHTIVVEWEHITNVLLSRGQINAYRICYQESALPRQYTCREVGGSENTYSIHGLKESTVYDIHMAASTWVGFGLDSEVQSIRTANNGNCTVPPVFPLMAVIAPNDTKVGLTWLEQSPSSEVPVQGFQLRLSKPKDEDFYSLPADTFSYDFSDLLPGLRYSFELIAYNECGMGPASAQSVTIPLSNEGQLVYPPPENVRATAVSSTSVQLNWDPVPSFSPSYYSIIYCRNIDRWKKNVTKVYRSNTFVVLKGLTPFTVYAFQVCVHQTGTVGQYSDVVYCGTKEDVPSAPVDFTAKPLNAHTVSVAWRPPLNPNGVIRAYNIMYVPYTPEANQEEPQWNRTRKKGTETSSTVRNLTSDTTYYFFLRACTSVGEGQPSTVAEVKTPQETRPGRPSDPEKGLFIGVILGSICIILCTVMAGIRYTRYHAAHKRKMAAKLVASNGQRVPISHQAQGGGGEEEMTMTCLSPMLGAQELSRPPNSQVNCELPMLGLSHGHLTSPAEHGKLPIRQAVDGAECTELPLLGARPQQEQYRHTLPGTSDGRILSSAVRHAPPTCSSASGSEVSLEGCSHWTALRESTSGDSGLIGDMECAAEDTSPDFSEKVLHEYDIGVHAV